MTTQQIKEIDSKCLNDYLATLPHTDLENPERTDPVRQVLIDPVKLF